MYEERKNTFSFRDIILQLLIVIMFVFIMIWLFPTKSYLKENFVGKDELQSEISSQLQSLYGRLFADNIETMRDAAQGYFTNARLPKNIGDSVTLTLDEMLEKKLVLQFKDSNNQACSANSSYVQVTKMDDEYQMKVQLSCSDYEDYIIVYMGCYDYCDGGICEKEEEPSTPEPERPVVNKKYKYEYRLVTQNEYSNWGPWSSWSTNAISSNSLRQVEMDTRNILTGYKTETYIDYETVIEYREETTKVQVGTEKKYVGTKIEDIKPAKGGTTTKKVYKAAEKVTSGGGYSNWVYQGYVTSKYALSSSNTVKYEYVSHKTTVDCTDVCKNVTIYTYKKSTRTYTEGKVTYKCPTGYKYESGSGADMLCYKYKEYDSSKLSCSSYGAAYELDGTDCIKEVAVYEYVPIYKEITTTIPVTVTKEVEKTRQVPIYQKKTYYRYRTRTQISEAGVSIKWSTSKNDQSLIKLGYKLTGNVVEV